MDESKKPLMIGLIIACLALAGVITYWTSRGDDYLDELEGQTQLMRCRQCKEVYEMPKADYLKGFEQYEGGLQTPALPCAKCGKRGAYAAVKCPHCGEVFEMGAMGPTEPADKCPKCGKRAKMSRSSSQ